MTVVGLYHIGMNAFNWGAVACGGISVGMLGLSMFRWRDVLSVGAWVPIVVGFGLLVVSGHR